MPALLVRFLMTPRVSLNTNLTMRAALMLAISSTNLPPRNEQENIITLLQRIWDGRTPMSNVLKQSEMLPEFLAKVLGKDTDQLESEEVYSFVKNAFSVAAARYALTHVL